MAARKVTEYVPGSVPSAGQLVFIGAAASVQFAGGRHLHLRVIRVDGRDTYEGWLWLEGYVVSSTGDAVERRTVFVRRAGLRAQE